MDKDLILTIDGNAIIHRAFHAYPPTLSTKEGVQVNAVYGFTVMLLEALERFDPKYVICTFDTKKPTFRHKAFKEYKATRKPTDPSLLEQFPLVEEVVEAFNIPILKRDGFEADDILGSLAQKVKDGVWNDVEMVILTGDRDLLQLIEGDVKVSLPVGSFKNLAIYDTEFTKEKFGYYPNQVVDYKAMVGDASDNIPGVKGIGDKTALGLLERYKTLNEIFKNLDSEKPRVKKLMEEGVEIARMSGDLATIKTDMDLELSIDAAELEDFDIEELTDVFKKFEFRTLISKIPKKIENEVPHEMNLGQIGMFGGVVELPNTDKEILEKTLKQGRVMGWGYISKDESADGIGYVLCRIVDKLKGLSDHMISMKGFTVDVSHETIFYNWSEFASSMSDGYVHDPALFAYGLSSGNKDLNLSKLAFDYLSEMLPEKIGPTDVKKALDVIIALGPALEEKAQSLIMSDYAKYWIEYFNKKFDANGVYSYLKCVDIPVSNILKQMEKRGVIIDYELLLKLENELEGLINTVTKQIFESIGHEFNLNSPKQLSEVLYSELKLVNHFNGKKSLSTREEVLKELQDQHPCITDILEYRELSKLQSTYVKPFIEITKTAHLNGDETSIHTHFILTGTTSGRFSSVNPNMQNLPARGEWSPKVRGLFVPRSGFKFVGVDYSQMEFRIMADISNDPVLIEDFVQGKDIHQTTAARVLGKKLEDVTKSERNLGKTMNFAILFGQTPFGLASLLDVDRETAKDYIEEYFKNYEGVKKYIKDAEIQAIDNGYVQAMFGRTRYISGLTSRNSFIRDGALREAINMPIQGGEADIMKLAMVDIDEVIKKRYLDDAFMLLQIHDELVFEVKEDRVDEFVEEVVKIMKNVVPLKVPLEVHASVGDNLYDLK